MKKLLFSLAAAALAIGSVNTATAQDLFSRRLSIGPMGSAGMHISTGEVPDGYKIKPVIGWSAGVLGEIDVSRLVSVDLALTYLQRGRYFYIQNNESYNTTIDVSYLSIAPMASFKGFLMGFGINLPMGATSLTKTPTQSDIEVDVPDRELKTVIDVKLGGHMPMFRTDQGNLSLLLLASYDIVKPFKDDGMFSAPVTTGRDFAGPDVSLHIGLSYQINVTNLDQ
jgi:hypothetical protein